MIYNFIICADSLGTSVGWLHLIAVIQSSEVMWIKII